MGDFSKIVANSGPHHKFKVCTNPLVAVAAIHTRRKTYFSKDKIMGRSEKSDKRQYRDAENPSRNWFKTRKEGKERGE